MLTEREILDCSDCRVWDPDNQPSVITKLLADPTAYDDRKFLMVRTGMSLHVPGGGIIPLWTEMLLCSKHE